MVVGVWVAVAGVADVTVVLVALLVMVPLLVLVSVGLLGHFVL